MKDFFESRWATSKKWGVLGYAENDICLVYLETKFDFSGNDVKNIKAAIEDPETGTMCDTSGWGDLEVSRYWKKDIWISFQFFYFSYNLGWLNIHTR